MRRWMITAVALLSVAFSSACSSTLSLTEVDDGQRFDLEVGQLLTVELPGNTSTGYSWRLQTVDEEVMRLLDDEYVQDPGPPGTGGTWRFDFEAVAAGETTVVLGLVPPGDPEPEAEDSFSVELTVR